MRAYRFGAIPISSLLVCSIGTSLRTAGGFSRIPTAKPPFRLSVTERRAASRSVCKMHSEKEAAEKFKIVHLVR